MKYFSFSTFELCNAGGDFTVIALSSNMDNTIKPYSQEEIFITFSVH